MLNLKALFLEANVVWVWEGIEVGKLMLIIFTDLYCTQTGENHPVVGKQPQESASLPSVLQWSLKQLPRE